MHWVDLKQVSKFTPVDDVVKLAGQPKFRLGNRTTYYLGQGFFLSFTNRKFKVEGGQRVEFGDSGEYALGCSYFKSREHAVQKYHLDKEVYLFEGQVLNTDDIKIEGNITTGLTFEEVFSILRQAPSTSYYQEGETRSMVDGEFVFQRNFIQWNDYDMYFFGKSNNTVMGGFSLTFKE